MKPRNLIEYVQLPLPQAWLRHNAVHYVEEKSDPSRFLNNLEADPNDLPPAVKKAAPHLLEIDRKSIPLFTTVESLLPSLIELLENGVDEDLKNKKPLLLSPPENSVLELTTTIYPLIIQWTVLATAMGIKDLFESDGSIKRELDSELQGHLKGVIQSAQREGLTHTQMMDGLKSDLMLGWHLIIIGYSNHLTDALNRRTNKKVNERAGADTIPTLLPSVAQASYLNHQSKTRNGIINAEYIQKNDQEVAGLLSIPDLFFRESVISLVQENFQQIRQNLTELNKTKTLLAEQVQKTLELTSNLEKPEAMADSIPALRQLEIDLAYQVAFVHLETMLDRKKQNRTHDLANQILETAKKDKSTNNARTGDLTKILNAANTALIEDDQYSMLIAVLTTKVQQANRDKQLTVVADKIIDLANNIVYCGILDQKDPNKKITPNREDLEAVEKLLEGVNKALDNGQLEILNQLFLDLQYIEQQIAIHTLEKDDPRRSQMDAFLKNFKYLQKYYDAAKTAHLFDSYPLMKALIAKPNSADERTFEIYSKLADLAALLEKKNDTPGLEEALKSIIRGFSGSVNSSFTLTALDLLYKVITNPEAADPNHLALMLGLIDLEIFGNNSPTTSKAIARNTSNAVAKTIFEIINHPRFKDIEGKAVIYASLLETAKYLKKHLKVPEDDINMDVVNEILKTLNFIQYELEMKDLSYNLAQRNPEIDGPSLILDSVKRSKAIAESLKGSIGADKKSFDIVDTLRYINNGLTKGDPYEDFLSREIKLILAQHSGRDDKTTTFIGNLASLTSFNRNEAAFKEHLIACYEALRLYAIKPTAETELEFATQFTSLLIVSQDREPGSRPARDELRLRVGTLLQDAIAQKDNLPDGYLLKVMHAISDGIWQAQEKDIKAFDAAKKNIALVMLLFTQPNEDEVQERKQLLETAANLYKEALAQQANLPRGYLLKVMDVIGNVIEDPKEENNKAFEAARKNIALATVLFADGNDIETKKHFFNNVVKDETKASNVARLKAYSHYVRAKQLIQEEDALNKADPALDIFAKQIREQRIFNLIASIRESSENLATELETSFNNINTNLGWRQRFRSIFTTDPDRALWKEALLVPKFESEKIGWNILQGIFYGLFFLTGVPLLRAAWKSTFEFGLLSIQKGIDSLIQRAHRDAVGANIGVKIFAGTMIGIGGVVSYVAKSLRVMSRAITSPVRSAVEGFKAGCASGYKALGYLLGGTSVLFSLAAYAAVIYAIVFVAIPAAANSAFGAVPYVGNALNTAFSAVGQGLSYLGTQVAGVASAVAQYFGASAFSLASGSAWSMLAGAGTILGGVAVLHGFMPTVLAIRDGLKSLGNKIATAWRNRKNPVDLPQAEPVPAEVRVENQHQPVLGGVKVENQHQPVPGEVGVDNQPVVVDNDVNNVVQNGVHQEGVDDNAQVPMPLPQEVPPQAVPNSLANVMRQLLTNKVAPKKTVVVQPEPQNNGVPFDAENRTATNNVGVFDKRQQSKPMPTEARLLSQSDKLRFIVGDNNANFSVTIANGISVSHKNRDHSVEQNGELEKILLAAGIKIVEVKPAKRGYVIQLANEQDVQRAIDAVARHASPRPE